MENKEQKIKNIRKVLNAKEVQVHDLEVQIRSQELIIKEIDDNVKNGWYIKEQEMVILEQKTESSKLIMELELERIKRDVESNYYPTKAKIILDSLKISLGIEQKTVEAYKKQIMMLERNHKEPKEEITFPPISSCRKCGLMNKDIKGDKASIIALCSCKEEKEEMSEKELKQYQEAEDKTHENKNKEEEPQVEIKKEIPTGRSFQ